MRQKVSVLSRVECVEAVEGQIRELEFLTRLDEV
jgi:hypothetical protein